MNFILRLLAGVVAVWLTVKLGQLLGTGLAWGGWIRALLFVVVLAVINAVIRPLLKVFALPINCLTFGLFAFIINALLFWLAAAITQGVKVPTFWAALFGSLVLAILSGIINSFIKHRSRSRGT